MGGEPNRSNAASVLVQLDDPTEERSVDIVASPDVSTLDEGWTNERPPDTARPEYEPDKFARHVESAAQRGTVPPAPTYEMLRDSCKALLSEEEPLDEARILRPESEKRKVSP
jgi:hypothetical protein